MSDHVKQHYVPQFYFRNFADDERVCAYNLANEEGYPPTHISNICYENNFYGDSEDEQLLSRLESELASEVHDVVNGRSLAELEADTEAKFFFDLFLSHTHARTKAAREEATEFSQELLELATEVGVEAGELDESALELVRDGAIRLEGPHHSQRQLISMYGPIYFSDLSRILIRNNTDIDFITSDHPVVFDNRRFKSEVEVGTIGHASPGLQVFAPLANDLLVLLYDAEAYAVDVDELGIVETDSERVVNGLNKLQLVHCLENCYYRREEDADRVHEWYQEVREHRPEDSVTREEIDVYDPGEDRVKDVVATHNTTIEYSPYLPFVRQRMSAEFRPVRNRRTYEMAQDLYDEAIERGEKRAENNDDPE